MKSPEIIPEEKENVTDPLAQQSQTQSNHPVTKPAKLSDRHVPKHPLPEELQKMPRDDTICKYCGVSYLIHHEIKALEERVKQLLAELSTCRGAEEVAQRALREKTEAERRAADFIRDLDASNMEYLIIILINYIAL